MASNSRLLTDEIVAAWGGPKMRAEFTNTLIGLDREGRSEAISDYLEGKGADVPGLQEQAERFFFEEVAWASEVRGA